MKRTLFLMAALMLLVAGLALAQTPTTSAPGPTLQREPGTANNDLPNPGQPQTDTSGTQTDTSGTMEHSMAPGTPAPGSTDSVVGTVVSFENDQLVLATQNGQRTFHVDSATVRPAVLSASLPVVVQFVSDSGGDRAVKVTENTQASAESQAPSGSTTGTGEEGSTPGAAGYGSSTGTQTTDTTGSTGSSYSGTTGTTGTTDTSGSMETTAGEKETGGIDSSGRRAKLPRTGSDLPLVGLFGLLTLVAAAGLRFLR